MTDQIEHSEPDAGTVAGETDFISAERLIFFSDAVTAIAMTLLAFALPLPHDIAAGASDKTVWDAVWAGHLDYLAFLISFAVIGRHWRSHHRLFRDVCRLDSRIITLNMGWLLMIVIIPFATGLLSGPGGFGVRLTIYAVIQDLTVLTFLLMSRHIRGSELLRKQAPASTASEDDTALITVAAMFALSIPVAFVTQWAFALWLAALPAVRVVRRLRKRDAGTGGCARRPAGEAVSLPRPGRAAGARPRRATPGSGSTGRTDDRPDPAGRATGPEQAEP